MADDRTDATLATLAGALAAHQLALEHLATRPGLPPDACALACLHEARGLVREAHALLHPLDSPLLTPADGDGRRTQPTAG